MPALMHVKGRRTGKRRKRKRGRREGERRREDEEEATEKKVAWRELSRDKNPRRRNDKDTSTIDTDQQAGR